MEKRLNPGSDEALEAGCRCPVMDNHYGRGYGGDSDTFVISFDCPIHANFEEKPLTTPPPDVK